MACKRNIVPLLYGTMFHAQRRSEHRTNSQRRREMQYKRIALVTGANQGVGFQVSKELVANGLTVLVGARNLQRGEAAAKEIGPGAIPLQFDVTDRVSIATAA